MAAEIDGKVNCLKLQIGERADLDIQDEKGQAALTVAAPYGHAECVKMLIREVVDLDIPKEHCSRALMLAAHTCSDTCLNTPLKALAEVDFSISRTMLDKKQTEPPLNPQDTTGKILNFMHLILTLAQRPRYSHLIQI